MIIIYEILNFKKETLGKKPEVLQKDLYGKMLRHFIHPVGLRNFFRS